MIEGPHTNKKTVGKSTERKRPQDFLRGADGLKASQHKQRIDVITRQPILIKIGCCKIQRSCNPKRCLPQSTIKVEQNTCARMAERFDLLKDTLHIPQVIDQVR